MAQITVSDEIAARINALAKRENSNIEDMLSEFLKMYHVPTKSQLEPLQDFIGMIDVDISDASATVKNR